MTIRPWPFARKNGPMEDPTEDLWMIGGVFLERFITIFDFDGGRLGYSLSLNNRSPQSVIEVRTNRFKEGQKVVPGQGESQCPL